MSSYWDRTVRTRISRRRMLAGAGGLTAGVAALSLVGCGSGGSSEDGGTGANEIQDESGMIYVPVNTASNAQTGGTYRHYTTGDITHFDAAISDTSQTIGLSASPHYPKLMEFKPGAYPQDADGSSDPEAAASWELSPDRLTLTLKLRENMLWDRRDPTNGRPIDSEDVLFTWGKFVEFNPGASAIAYHPENAPGSAIESWEAPDANTIVAHLHAPEASIYPLLSSRFFLQPREAESQFDPKLVVRGHGPFLLDEYVASSHFRWSRNPDYYRAPLPHYDTVEVPIVAEQSTRLAQFKTGNIFSDVLLGSQEDIVPTKQDHPETLMLQAARFPERVTYFMTFGWEDGSPFRDVRMRQAVSMAIDREAYADVIDNRDRFAEHGIEVPVRWNTVVGAGWDPYWLDPTSSQFGENAKYLEHRIEDSKALLAAAGYPNGLDVQYNVMSTGQFGPIYNRIADIYSGMLLEAGIRLNYNNMEFVDWVNNVSQGYRSALYRRGERNGFEGIGMQGERGYPTAAVQVYNQFNAAGQGYRGNSPDGENIADGDPYLNDLTIKINQEFDPEAQISMMHDLIRYATGMAYYCGHPSSAKTFELWWPVLSNNGAFTPYPGTNLWSSIRSNWWIDPTKAPLA